MLDISALDSPNARESQTFALHLTQLYARLIEDAYFLRRYHNQTVLRCGVSREFVQVNGQYLFAIDEGGRIEAANTAERSLMSDNAAGFIDGVSGVTELFECDLRDVWRIPYDHDDQVKAFRHHANKDILFATLIKPKTKPADCSGSIKANNDERVPELDQLAADDPVMRRALSLAKRRRNRDVGLLILGETGTGKEVLAKAIHQSGSRAGGAFIAVNCAAIPESLIESELFGYVAGAFTGARAKGMRGLIQQAEGGTLFLDEIGDMPLHLQTRLLRVLAEGEVLPVGAEAPVRVNCRFMAATHQNLEHLMQSGAFRSDLYYRLNGATLKLPSLCQRADRQYVINGVLRRLIKQGQVQDVHIRADAMSAMLAYHWPGNIRELVNALAFAEATCDDHEITAEDLPDACLKQKSRPAPTEPSESPDGRGRLLLALETYRWNITEVARRFDVSRPTIYRWLQHHGIEQPRFLGKR